MIYELAKTLCQPFTFLTILLGLTLLLVWLRREAGVRSLIVVTLAWLGIYAVATPYISAKLLDTLDQQYPPPSSLPDDVQAIVTLGGGLQPLAPFRTEYVPDVVGYGRCVHAAALYEQLQCPIIVCGGPSQRFPGAPPIGDAMKQMLVRFGVPSEKVIIEDRSQTTYENATESAEILRARGWTKIAVVTDARHMPRSVRCFHKLGVDTVPLASDYRSATGKVPSVLGLLPTTDGLRATQKAVHEWVGMGWYWWQGRI